MTAPAAPPQNKLTWLPWLLCGIVVALAIYVWGSSLNWNFSGLSIYLFFPVLGLTAWSILWSQYMTGLMLRTFLKGADVQKFFSITGYIVLFAIVLHPGLLAYQRFRDGFGLPPGSETSYVAPGMAWIVVLAMVSLLVFLSYELHRWFQDRRWWKYVVRLSDAAMLAIFYHGLELGTQTHVPWFRAVWWFYGAMLLVALVINYASPISRHAQKAKV